MLKNLMFAFLHFYTWDFILFYWYYYQIPTSKTFYHTKISFGILMFVPNITFLYPLKTLENLKVLCFQGVQKCNIRNKWVKRITWSLSDFLKYLCNGCPLGILILIWSALSSFDEDSVKDSNNAFASFRLVSKFWKSRNFLKKIES